MIVWTLYRGEHVAFGQYHDEELTQMKLEGWRIVHSVDLTHHKIRYRKRKKQVLGKVVGINKNGIRVMQ